MGARKKDRPGKGKPVKRPNRAIERKGKADPAAELEIANRELALQNKDKEMRAQELFLANIELSYQNAQREKRAAELAEAIKDLEAFAYISSHHLQEPLRKIRSFVDQIIRRDASNLSEKGRHDLGRIDVASARISQLIQDVYTYSRINVEEAVFERLNPHTLITTVIDELSGIIDQKKATIEIDVPNEVRVIPMQFRQVIHQLLDNALKFSRPEVPPRIILSGKTVCGEGAPGRLISGLESYCCIEVADNGIGFDQQFNEAIFRMFEKLHPVENYRGTGIGLAIVRKIMNRHGGLVEAASIPGAGATFRLYFPERQK